MKLLLCLAAAVTLAVTVTSIAADPIPVTGPITLIGTVQERHVLFSDHNFPGRETWYLSLASTRAKGKKFEYWIMACSFVSLTTSIRECVGTFSLPRGKIMVAGSFLYNALFALAVTGGTDAYSGDGGNMLARKVSGSRASYWLDFTLK